MDRHRPINGSELLQRLEQAGFVPERCLSATIEAKVGEPVRITYTIMGDDRLLDMNLSEEQPDG